jgi:tripartite-type tricarboxylate transporter receptor subunit TctC
MSQPDLPVMGADGEFPMWNKGIGAILITIVVAALSCTASKAQSDYPNRAIKIVVPTPPGPTLDSLPRLIASHLSERWKVPVIIENVPGVAQNLGAETVAKSEPDGYTVLAAPKGPLTMSQYEYTKLNFDPAAFVPVSVFASQPATLVASTKTPFDTLQAMIAYAKANPGRINYGSPGTGSSLQLMVEILKRDENIQMVHVPYKGVAPAEADLLAGQIDLLFDPLGSALPYVRDGKFKALGVTGKSRTPELPDVPAIAEAIPDFVFAEWFAFVAPPRTSPEIAGKFSQAVAETLRLPDVVRRFHDVSVTTVGSSPSETAALLKKESDKWRSVVAQLGATMD